MTTNTFAQDETARRRSIGFLNWAHFLDHYVILIFPTVVIGLEAVYGRSYGELLVLSTAAFTAFGLFALPAGWLADKWSRRNMIALFFFGTGICSALVGMAESFETLAIALFGVGLFAAIYHPVGTPMVVDAATVRAAHGVQRHLRQYLGLDRERLHRRDRRDARLTLRLLHSGRGVRRFGPRLSEIRAGRRAQARRAGAGPGRGIEPVAHRRGRFSFLVLAFWVGLVFNAITIMLPKLVESRVTTGASLAAAGVMATAVFLCGGLAQFAMGRAVERVVPHIIMSVIASVQVVGVLLALYLSGLWLLPGLALTVAAIYGQVTVNDIVLARYAPAPWRGRTTRSVSS